MPSQVVDHLILAGDVSQAVDFAEQAASDLLDQSQLTTLLGLAAKLPTEHANTRPKLQIAVAWANALLHRAINQIASRPYSPPGRFSAWTKLRYCSMGLTISALRAESSTSCSRHSKPGRV
jgi:hypothetical protein